MAIRASCPQCGKRFSAPEDYVGRKIDCPRCRHRWVLRTPEEDRAAEHREREERRRDEEGRQKLALLEELERRGAPDDTAKPYYERFGTGVGGVRHYHPGTPSRFLRLRALSDVLILCAWVVALLGLAGLGLSLWHWAEGIVAAPALATRLLAWLLGGLGAFLVLKFLGELAFFLADLGDQQHDLVQLLRDIRDNTEPREDSGEG